MWTFRAAAACIDLGCACCMQLTPLPRLSLEFQSSCSSRRRLSTSSSCSSRSSLDGLSLGLSSSNSLQDSCHHGRWQPSMTRIRSGHNLELLGREQGSVFDAVDRGSVCRLLEPDSGSDCAASSSGEATESLGHSVLTPELQIVSEVRPVSCASSSNMVVLYMNTRSV